MSYDFGVLGVGVMGANLARNIERNGFSVLVYDRAQDKVKALLDGPAKGKRIGGASTPAELAAGLAKPRRILIMVNAGAPVDSVIESLKSYLEPGDILIDGGNSHYTDTERRFAALQLLGLRFVGMGVSGGEEGALWGPSLMPGGDRETYELLEPILTHIAAKTESGPCVTYIGARSAGHFVKMVHNGIEYGDMQLIAESYDLMRNALGMPSSEIADTYERWNEGELESYLIEITARIVGFADDLGGKEPLIDRIVDAAGQKGTGKWTTQAALDLAVPIPTITAAVDARIVSARRALRQRAAKLYPAANASRPSDRLSTVNAIRAALYAAKICSYAQGFDLLQVASKELQYGLRLDELARIWKGGCIIRAAFLDKIRQAFQRDATLPNLLLDAEFASELAARFEPWRRTVQLGIDLGFTPPAMSASLAYFDTFRRERLPANLIQAQRDYFGAHTYERLDRTGIFHTEWHAGEGDR